MILLSVSYVIVALCLFLYVMRLVFMKDTPHTLRCPQQACRHFQRKCSVCCRQTRIDMFEKEAA